MDIRRPIKYQIHLILIRPYSSNPSTTTATQQPTTKLQIIEEGLKPQVP